MQGQSYLVETFLEQYDAGKKTLLVFKDSPVNPFSRLPMIRSLSHGSMGVGNVSLDLPTSRMLELPCTLTPLSVAHFLNEIGSHFHTTRVILSHIKGLMCTSIPSTSTLLPFSSLSYYYDTIQHKVLTHMCASYVISVD